MRNRTPIVEDAQLYLEEILENKLPAHISYHNLSHTQGVVHAAQEIGQASGLSDNELEIIELACWFHDVGFAE